MMLYVMPPKFWYTSFLSQPKIQSILPHVKAATVISRVGESIQLIFTSPPSYLQFTMHAIFLFFFFREKERERERSCRLGKGIDIVVAERFKIEKDYSLARSDCIKWSPNCLLLRYYLGHSINCYIFSFFCTRKF